MNCKNHNERESIGVCSTCGNNFCNDCLTLDLSQCTDCSTKFDISKDILNDILNSVELPQNTITNFDPTDILKQIEDEILLHQDSDIQEINIAKELFSNIEIEKLDFKNNKQTKKISDENTNLGEKNQFSMDSLLQETISIDSENIIIDDILTESTDKVEDVSIILEKSLDEYNDIENENFVDAEEISLENVVMNEINSIDTDEKSMDANISNLDVSKSIKDTDLTLDVTENISNIESVLDESTETTISKIKQSLFGAKNVVIDKAHSIDTSGAKESVKNMANTTKTQASKLSKEAKVKSAGIAAGVAAGAAITKEKAVDATNTAKSKMHNSKEEMDTIINKIKEENENGEYDRLLGRFTTSYGEGKKSASVGDEQYALPLKINAIIYFIASLIPGIAQFYLGLTKRGTTILLIGSCFLFITNTPSLFIITAILSFADAYKLRNIYYRGGKIEDTNDDITSLLTNGYVILIIIFTIIINLFN